MLILSTGGKGTGVEAEGSNYPFVQPSSDIQGLLADLWLEHEYHDVVLPLTVSRLAGFQEAFDGLPSAAQLTIVDAADTTVFDSAGANYYWKDWGPRLRIHEWLFAGLVCRAVQHRAVPEPQAAWPEVIVPANGVLDERASMLLPRRLLVLTEKASQVSVAGEVMFVNGWNVDIGVAAYPEPLCHTTALTYSANPGGGAGRYPGCVDPALAIRTINGVGPDSQGNFTLAADRCYFVRQPVDIGTDGLAVPVAATLDLGNDCGPCCDCDDYVNVQKAVLNVETRLRTTGAAAEATRDAYAAAVDRWNAQKACRESQIVQVTAATTASVYADLNVTICNATGACLVDMIVNITVTTKPGGTWKIAAGTTYISQAGQAAMVPYQLTPSSLDPNTVTAFLDAINPMTYGRVKTRASWFAQLPPGTMLTVKVEVESPRGGPPFPQTASITVLMT